MGHLACWRGLYLCLREGCGEPGSHDGGAGVHVLDGFLAHFGNLNFMP
jgi:hypothetical protein